MKKHRTIELSDDFVSGDQISLGGWNEWNIALSEHGSAHVYLGSLPANRQLSAVSAAARQGLDRNSSRFVSVDRGCVSLDYFFTGPTRYQVLQDHLVWRPRGADAYFGVLQRGSREEDPVLTRQVFGATYHELNDFLGLFTAVVDGFKSRFDRYPRTTFSRTRGNDCDLTGVWIPPEYPYIAFTSSEYFKGHVSLYGFYRLLAFLCNQYIQVNGARGNRLYQELLAAGAQQEQLDYMIDSGNPVHPPLVL